MTTEEKAKAYDEAIKRAKPLMLDTNFSMKNTVISIFPELNESEDDMIMKAIMEVLKRVSGATDVLESEGTTFKKAMIWFEKQKAKERLDRMAPIYNDKESFESALEKAWKYYNESASRTVDSFEDDYIECVFSKGFREGFLYKEKQKEQKPAEWSEKDNIMLENIILCLKEYCLTDEINWLKSLRSQSHKEIYQAAKHDLAIKFMNYLDDNRPKDKMCLSNSECEDIDKAFNENDLAKIIRYVEKYKSPMEPNRWRHYIWAVNLRFDYDGLVKYEDNGSYEIVTAGNKPKRQVNGEYILLKDISSVDWKPSKEQMRYLKKVYESYYFCDGERTALESLYNDLEKLL